MQRFQQIAERMKLPIEYYKDLQEFFNQIPIIPSITTWETLFSHFLSLIFNETILYKEQIIESPTSFSIKNDFSYSLNPSTTASLSILKERYEIENLLLKAVSEGNAQKAVHYQNEFMRFQVAARVSDPIRNLKNLGFTLNTLLRKAVESADVHPFYIDKLSTQSAIQIENCSNVNQLSVIYSSLIRKYCQLVSQYSRKQCSAIV